MNFPFPVVELSAVLIENPSGLVLFDFNSRWGAFTLPSSKRHMLPPAVEHGQPVVEEPLMAALRAAAEVLGHPLQRSSLQPWNIEVEPYHQSGSDGQWKRYTFSLFRMTTAEQPQPLTGHTAIWLDPKTLADVEPISPTARMILAKL